MPLSPGTALGPYEVVAPLGAGGMGEVYRARDTRLHRDVAIKVLQESVAGAAAWERFHREARAASALNHPHICAVYDVGETEGRPFLVMELLEGQTLREYVGGKPADAATTIAVGIQIADALDAAHAKSVIHRDIKPGNIMITARGHVKVLDFGLARHVAVSDADQTRTVEPLTEAGSVMGTPRYIAPEILQGGAADVRSDLWSLGVVLHEMLAGRPPFEGSSGFDMAASILRGQPAPLPASVAPELRSIVERCLEKRPDQRYQRADDVRRALAGVQPTATAAAVRPDQRKWVWTAVIAAVVLLIAGGGYIIRQRRAPVSIPLTVTGAPASKNRDANDAFTLAMQFMRVQNDVARAQQQLEKALEHDPHFAEARRYHAFYHVVALLNGFSNDTSVAYKAEEELRQAERDDPTLASLPSAFAAVYMLQGRRDMIPTAALDRATVQASTARDAILWRGIMSYLAGENDVVKELQGRALEREPLFGAARMFLGEALRMESDVQGAMREQRRVLEQAPGNMAATRFLALTYMDADQVDRARVLLEEKRGTFERNFVWRTTWALLLARERRRAEALAAMDPETLKFARGAFVVTLDAAEFYALLGDTTKAVEWVETAVRNGDERVDWFRRDPRLATIQNDPRFQQILQSIEARRKRSP